jgi:hypothetical protein
MTVCGTGSGNFPAPGDPDLNNSILSAQAGQGGIAVSWTYPALLAEAVAHTLLYRYTANDFGSATVIRVVAGDYHFDKSDVVIGTTYYYWIEIVSVNGTVGDTIGPASATMLPPIDDLLALLAGNVASSHLNATLKSRIDEIDNVAADLLTEATARSTQESYYDGLLATMTADLNAVDTLIDTEITNRATADVALVTQIDVVLAQSNANSAALVVESTARADADTAAAVLITALEASVATNTGAITTEQTARAAADSALATDITNVTAITDANAAAIVTEATARSNADGALTTQINSVSAAATSNTSAIGINASAIATETTARADGDNALASSLTTLTSTVDGNTTSIATLTTATDGLSAEYSVRIDAGGRVVGFGLYGNATSAEFIVRADTFAIAMPGKDDVFPFIVNNVAGVPVIALDAATFIPDATIVNAMIGNYIQSNNYEYTPATSHTGWRISKDGEISASAITIYDATGNAILDSGGLSGAQRNIIEAQTLAAASWSHVSGTAGAPADNAQVNTIDAGDGLNVLDPTANTKLVGIATGAQVNTINAGDGLNALDSTANTKLGGVEAGAQVNSIGLNVKINHGSFSAANNGEMYVHGYANGVAANVTGYIYLGTTKTSVAAGVIEGSGKDGWIMLRTSGSFGHNGSQSSMAVVKNDGGTWYEDNNFGWTPFSPNNTCWVVGVCLTSGSDAGGIYAATLWPAGIIYTQVGAFSDLDKITVANASTYIADLAVDTLQIANQAVSIPTAAGSSSATMFTTTVVTLATLTFTSTGAPVLIQASAYVKNAVSNSGASYYLRLYRGTTLKSQLNIAIPSVDISLGSGACGAITFKDTPGAGSVTYYLKAVRQSGYYTLTAYEKWINALEVKK